jgi:hypothetical protein
MAKMSSVTKRIAAYPHHFNHSAPKTKPSWSNPQGRLYVKVRCDNGELMVVQTRPVVAEVMSSVSP